MLLRKRLAQKVSTPSVFRTYLLILQVLLWSILFLPLPIQHLDPQEPKDPDWHHDDQKLTNHKPLNLWIHGSWKTTEISEPLLRIDTAANLPHTPPSSSAETRLYGLAMASSGPRWADAA